MPTHIQEDIMVKFLTFDGHSTMFGLANNNQGVLMWSVNGTFSGQIQLFLDNSLDVTSLAVDSVNHTMYVVFSFNTTVR
jgi:hypothetical protein